MAEEEGRPAAQMVKDSSLLRTGQTNHLLLGRGTFLDGKMGAKTTQTDRMLDSDSLLLLCLDKLLKTSRFEADKSLTRTDRRHPNSEKWMSNAV